MLVGKAELKYLMLLKTNFFFSLSSQQIWICVFHWQKPLLHTIYIYFIPNLMSHIWSQLHYRTLFCKAIICKLFGKAKKNFLHKNGDWFGFFQLTQVSQYLALNFHNRQHIISLRADWNQNTRHIGRHLVCALFAPQYPWAWLHLQWPSLQFLLRFRTKAILCFIIWCRLNFLLEIQTQQKQVRWLHNNILLFNWTRQLVAFLWISFDE